MCRPLASGYGTHHEVQEDILKKMYTCCETIRVGKSRNLLPFQKGFMMTINSLFGLSSDIQSNKLKYILTAYLNQNL